MEKKMTAVQWLSNEIDFMFSFVNQETANKYNGLVQQALAIERKQIEEAFTFGYRDGASPIVERELFQSPSDYYTRTYSEPLKDKI